ncbi:MAG TPA: hypothetical protein VGW38_26870 [Chloroflexota bacterium]|nr:hypothetical protein [Chloroflexota bacterium]
MCYSRYQSASEARKKEQAREQEAAQQKRADVIDTLLSDATQRADAEKPQSDPAEHALKTK